MLPDRLFPLLGRERVRGSIRAFSLKALRGTVRLIRRRPLLVLPAATANDDEDCECDRGAAANFISSSPRVLSILFATAD